MKIPPRSIRRHPERSEAESKDPVEFHGDVDFKADLRPPGTGDYWVYIMTNERRTVLYIGITNNLQLRVSQHGCGEGGGFSRRYQLSCLVYYENFPDPNQAIAREKQLKGWTRAKKVALIAKFNPGFVDLAVNFSGEPSGAKAEGDRTAFGRGPSTPLRSAQDDRVLQRL